MRLCAQSVGEGTKANSMTPEPHETPSKHVRLVAGLEFRTVEGSGRSRYVCFDPRTAKYYHFGAAEYEVVQMLQRGVAVDEIPSCLQPLGLDWTSEEVAQLLATLVQAGLIEVAATEGAPGPVPAPQADAAMVWQRRLGHVVSQRIPLFSADRPATWLTRRLHVLFRPLGVAVWLLLVASASYLAVTNSDSLKSEFSAILTPSAWPLFLLLWMVTKVIHEAGHAVAAKRHDVELGKAGVILFFLAPLAYVDVTHAWRLPKRWSRIQIALAGVYFELALAAVAIWIWNASHDYLIRHLALQLAVIAGPATLLVNANPLLRLDGYYALSDLLGIPNLRMHGRGQLVGIIEQGLFSRQPPASRLTGWQKPAATVHAICSVLFQIVWMGGLLWGVWHWAGALGVLLGGAAFLCWVALPLIRWIAKQRLSATWPTDRRRLLLAASVCGVVFGAMMWIPSPLGCRLPAVVRYADEQIARAASDGFVTAVFVQTGQAVVAGDVLLAMDDPELRVEELTLKLELEASEIRYLQLQQQRQFGLAAAELDQQAALTGQLLECQRKLQALKVIAIRDGMVTTPRLDRLEGRHVKQGQVLVQIGDEGQKELQVAIPADDLPAYRLAMHRAEPLRVRLRGGQYLRVLVGQPSPRASLNIPHPALAATAGGPLVLMPGTEQEPGEGSQRLATPHSETTCLLVADQAFQLHAGQRGVLMLGERRSIVQRLRAAIRQD